MRIVTIVFTDNDEGEKFARAMRYGLGDPEVSARACFDDSPQLDTAWEELYAPVMSVTEVRVVPVPS